MILEAERPEEIDTTVWANKQPIMVTKFGYMLSGAVKAGMVESLHEAMDTWLNQQMAFM